MKLKKWMLVLFVISGAMSSAQAFEVCDTAGVCRVYQIEDNTILPKDFTPSLTDSAKNSDGNFLHLNQYDANSFCRNKGLRLPTARELAHFSQSQGAQGISETPKDGYRLVKGLDSEGNQDYFYFSSQGYMRPAGDLGKKYFWSSSMHPNYPGYAYGLDGYDGAIVTNDVKVNFGVRVRCVQSR
jgi:hypothetical protein